MHFGFHRCCCAPQGVDCALPFHPECTRSFLAGVQITRELWCWGCPQPSAHPGSWAELHSLYRDIAVSTRAGSWRWLKYELQSHLWIAAMFPFSLLLQLWQGSHPAETSGHRGGHKIAQKCYKSYVTPELLTRTSVVLTAHPLSVCCAGTS